MPSVPEIKKLYYSIGEVSEIVGLKQYVLRYWESEFPMLRPQKNRAGNRIYRQKDIDMVLRIKDLLYEQKYTIEGARRQIRMVASGTPPQSREDEKYRTILSTVKGELQEILDILSAGEVRDS